MIKGACNKTKKAHVSRSWKLLQRKEKANLSNNRFPLRQGLKGFCVIRALTGKQNVNRENS